MKEAADRSGFIAAIRNREACFLKIHYQDLLQTIEVLTGLGLAGNPSPDNWQRLSGLCPQCSAWVDGDALSMVTAVEQIGRDKVHFNQYGEVSHLLDLRCINSACPSSEIVLIWQGEDGISRQIDQHLQRVRVQLNGSNNKRLDLLDKLAEEQAMRFVQDTIFGLQKRSISNPLVVGRKISSIVIWVTVLPQTDGAFKRAFPKGYNEYLSFLLKNSGYDEGETAVAHWIAFNDQGQQCLDLALHSEKNSLGTIRALTLYPVEMLQKLGDT